MNRIVKIIDINEGNIDDIGLFCKKSKKKFTGYQNKVKWMKERFKEGLKYKLAMVKEGDKESPRGMIEYIPGEYNWRGILADGWMVLHCLWVVGAAKKKGYGTKLLEEAIREAKEAGMLGVVGMSASKGGWLPNKKIYVRNGFEKVDEIDPYFELYAKAFASNAQKPKFYPISKEKKKEYNRGITILYSEQCPYIVDFIEELEDIFKGKTDLFNPIKINNCKEAQQNGVYPYGTYCILCDGKVSLFTNPTRKAVFEFLSKNK